VIMKKRAFYVKGVAISGYMNLIKNENLKV
jgi:hypothetical protein